MNFNANCVLSATWRMRRTSWTGGGPAAVLFASEILLGSRLRELELLYEFQPRGFFSNRNAFEYVKKIRNDPFFVVYYWVAELARYWGRAAFVAHDAVTAAGCALYGVPYILVYHSQGGLLYEHESQNGRKASGALADALVMAEELAFSKAHKVYFPSHGAKAAYLATRSVDLPGAKLADVPLYNTAPPFLVDAPLDPELSRPDIFGKVNFISVGGITHAKGIDLLPAYLGEYRQAMGPDFRWFVFTNGTHPVKQQLQELSEKHGISENLILVDRPVPRPILQSVLRRCQYYIMSHRNSIFDLATLEAMQLGVVPLLAPTGGNLEVNLHDNVLFLPPEPAGMIELLKSANREDLAVRNRQAYHSNFGGEAFQRRYFDAFNDLTA